MFYHSIIKSVMNMRELGGITAADGRKVKKGLLYRGGSLHRLTGEDKKTFDALKIGHIFDYRDDTEAGLNPDYSDGAQYHLAPVVQNAMQSLLSPQYLVDSVGLATPESRGLAAEYFARSYREIPFANQAYADTLAALDTGKPLYIHCAAGKDRTGVGAALILLALGAGDSAVRRDYLKSNYYRIVFNAKVVVGTLIKTRNPSAAYVMRKCCIVRPQFIDATLDAIKEKYASYDEFFLGEYGITGERMERWRSLYLEA